MKNNVWILKFEVNVFNSHLKINNNLITFKSPQSIISAYIYVNSNYFFKIPNEVTKYLCCFEFVYE